MEDGVILFRLRDTEPRAIMAHLGHYNDPYAVELSCGHYATVSDDDLPSPHLRKCLKCQMGTPKESVFGK
jgi:hypothetical protein